MGAIAQDVPMAQMIRVTEARARLAELVTASDEEDVLLIRHGRPAAVLMSVRRHADLMELIDDLEDRLAVHERADEPAISFDKFLTEMGDDL